ncbi:hypothetical protein [Hydrogenophaga soli]
MPYTKIGTSRWSFPALWLNMTLQQTLLSGSRATTMADRRITFHLGKTESDGYHWLCAVPRHSIPLTLPADVRAPVRAVTHDPDCPLVP